MKKIRVGIYRDERYPDYGIIMSEEEFVHCDIVVELDEDLLQEFLKAQEKYTEVSHKLAKIFNDNYK